MVAPFVPQVCRGIRHASWKKKEADGHLKEYSREELTISLPNLEYIHDAGSSIIDIPGFATGEMDVVGYLRCNIKDAKSDSPFHIEEPFVVRHVISRTQTQTERSDTNNTMTMKMEMLET